MDETGQPSVGGPLLRLLKATEITGTDAATLATALNTFFSARDEEQLVMLQYVADFNVVVVYVE